MFFSDHYDEYFAIFGQIDLKHIDNDNIYLIKNCKNLNGQLAQFVVYTADIEPTSIAFKYIRPVYSPKVLPEHYHSCGLIGWKTVDGFMKLHYIIVQPDYLYCNTEHFGNIAIMCTVGPVHDTNEWSNEDDKKCRNNVNEKAYLSVLVCYNFENSRVIQDLIGISIIQTADVGPECRINDTQKDYIVFLGSLDINSIPEEYHYLPVKLFHDMFLPKGPTLFILVLMFLTLIMIYTFLEYFII